MDNNITPTHETENETAYRFNSISDIVSDPHFQKFVQDNLTKLITARLVRPAPKPGFRYKRDWYDRMYSQNTLNATFFLKNIESIWVGKSLLSMEVRKIIRYVCDLAILQTNDAYLEEGKDKI